MPREGAVRDWLLELRVVEHATETNELLGSKWRQNCLISKEEVGK